MTRAQVTREVFAVGFFLCSILTLHSQQAYFSESVAAFADSSYVGSSCAISSLTNPTIKCAGHWDNQYSTGSAQSIAVNSYGSMKAYSFSEITVVLKDSYDWDQSYSKLDIGDVLSIIGLTGEPTASLKLSVECLDCVRVPGPSYFVEALWNNGINVVSCTVNYGKPPQCILTIPLTYNAGTGQPDPVQIARDLYLTAFTSVINGAAGATVTTSLSIGYPTGSGATLSAAVVDSKGHTIQGVTVVGTSGHLYN